MQTQRKNVLGTRDPYKRLPPNNYYKFSVPVLIFHILCVLTIVGFGVSTAACNGANRDPDQDPFMKMNMELPSGAIVKRDKDNATIILLKGKNLSENLEKHTNFQTLQRDEQYADLALAFISANRLLFKIDDPTTELAVKSINIDDLGFKHIKFQQQFDGMSVWASELNVHLNRMNQVYLIQGRYIPTPVGIERQAVLQEEAVKQIVAESLDVAGYDCFEHPPEKIVYASAALEARLAYRITVPLRATEGWVFIIDAVTGAVLEKLPAVYKNTSF